MVAGDDVGGVGMKLFIKLTVALMIGSMLLVAPAGANTTITTHTKLTVNDKSVKAGTKVNWKIEVNAKKIGRAHV